MPELSVVIPTYNRGDLVIDTINSIIKSSYKNFEIIIVEQNRDRTAPNKFGNYFNKNNVRYVNIRKIGASNAKNVGISLARGKVVVFTDDDCIADKNWLKNISSFFKRNPDIDAAFGSVYPYKPLKNNGLICPSTFKNKSERLISKPTYHKNTIGFGNNFAVRKNSLKKLGGFKTWLGPGSGAFAAEDAEYAQRILFSGRKIVYNPEIKIFHNKWLTRSQMEGQMNYYDCGENACYSYYYFQGKRFAGTVLNKNIRNLCKRSMEIIRRYFTLKRGTGLLGTTYSFLKSLRYQIKGLAIGVFYAVSEPIRVH